MNDKEKQFRERVECGIAYCEDTPDKQIEEMAKDLHKTHAISSVCSGKNCDLCRYDSLKNFDEYTCIDLSLANDLYSAGYRKLPEDSVVLSREEAERFRGQTINLKKVKLQERKETAEKFESELKAFIKVWKMAEDDAMSIAFYRALFEKIGELAKQFGVEIKE